jgi:hypothetical protein
VHEKSFLDNGRAGGMVMECTYCDTTHVFRGGKFASSKQFFANSEQDFHELVAEVDTTSYMGRHSKFFFITQDIC